MTLAWSWTPQKLLPLNFKLLFVTFCALIHITTSDDSWAFTRQRYVTSIPECRTTCEKTYVHCSERIGVQLPYAPESIRFKIVDGDDSEYFKVETEKVGDFAFLFLRTKTTGNGFGTLNREGQPLYVLRIRAKITLPSGQNINAFADIEVHITDINDASPLLTQPAYTFNIPSNTQLFSTVGSVAASDADEGINAEIYYYFEQWTSEFAIHSTSGVIYLTSNLTHYRNPLIENTVIAVNRGQSGRRGQARIQFRIIQENQYAPVISWEPVPELSPFSPPGITVLLFKVTDYDSGKFGEISDVRLVSAESTEISDCRSYFRIILPTTANNQYQLTVTQSDMSMLGPQVNISVKASDGGNPAKTTIEVITLRIDVSSAHGQTQEVIEFEIEETIVEGTPLYYLQPPPNTVDATYLIIRDPLNAFRIRSTSGVLFLNKPIDAERHQKTTLQVKLNAKLDAGNEKMEIVYRFEITILDENDNAPQYANTRELTLDENADEGQVVFIASATDADIDDHDLTYSIIDGEGSPFAINPYNGEVTLTRRVDYEEGKHVYHVIVRSRDHGVPYRRETDKIFRVTITNSNDNAPMFVNEHCTGYIRQDIEIGAKLTTISAIDLDQDNSPIMFSLRNAEHDVLAIDAYTGEITLIQAVSSLTGRTLRAFVSASDGLNIAEGTEISILVKSKFEAESKMRINCVTTDANRRLSEVKQTSERLNPTVENIMLLPASSYNDNVHTPRFVGTIPSQFSLPEDLPVGSIVTNLVATDQDSGFNGMIQYYIESGNLLGHFAINGSTGAVIVFAHLDREANPVYDLKIVAKDMAINSKSASVRLSMNVLDANDNAPRFITRRYSAYVNESVEIGKEVYMLIAEDKDEGNNGKIKYTMITDTDSFEINPDTGMIRVKGFLDREAKDKHVLIIEASDQPDKKDETLYARITFTIYLQDVNDNIPTFMNNEYHVKVREDMPIGSVIANLVAQDTDLPATGGEVNYKFVKGDESYFHIDRLTGIVRLAHSLDYENKTRYQMTVRARDNGTEPLKSTCQLIVDVLDVNENLFKPEFERRVYSTYIKENLPEGSRVVRVIANDLDTAASDSRLAYSIRKGSGLGLFEINNQGWIHTSAVLDRETVDHYWLSVYVQDHGSVPLSSSVEVYISVGDENDNVPETELPIYYPHVLENSPDGTVVMTMKAEDRDVESSITYEILHGNTQSYFSIDSQSGVISTTQRKLNRESDEVHVLEVLINDGGENSHTTSVRVWITVDDENDNSPIVKTPAECTIWSTHNFTRPVYRVLASDDDRGANGRVTYSLENEREDFRINENTGELYLIGNMERDEERVLTIRASDNGEVPLVLIHKLTVLFTTPDRSDQTPTFAEPFAQTFKLENTPVYEYVETLYASDPDSTQLHYYIEDGADYEGFPMFFVEPKAGSLRTAAILDYESKMIYNLNISLSDGYNTAYMPVTVNVNKVNEHPPQFSERIYEAVLPETADVGTEVIKVTATDLDGNTAFSYQIHSASSNLSYTLFACDHKTGVISVSGNLDREASDIHKLVVRVKDDDGLQIYSDYASVIIRVEDKNDHPPQFSADNFNVKVHEMQSVGSTVTQVQARDEDRGDNAQVQYALMSGNVGYTFNIDPDLGMITLARRLDRTIRSKYELTVVASDKGTPPQSSSCLITITVTVADERPPMFDSHSFTAELKENQPAGSFIIALSSESQSTLSYRILDEDSAFSINPNSGILTSSRRFDYEDQNVYLVNCLAEDIAGHSVHLTVAVHILDVNDNRPEFKQSVYYGTISEGAADGSVVLMNGSIPLVLSARDYDSNLNALLDYRILEPEARKYFQIGSNTGAITTVNTPDREHRAQFRFTVQVQDQALDTEFRQSPWLGVPSGEESLSAADPATVIIDIEDINDEKPVFVKTDYKAVVLVPTYKDIEVLHITAYDRDLSSDLTYELYEGNRNGHFYINKTSGDVLVNKPKEIRGSYEIIARVTDGIHESFTSLSVTIITNNNPARILFSQSEYMGSVRENTTEIQTVTIIEPLHVELNEPVRFELLNGNDLFDVGQTSGIITTRPGAVIDREFRDSYDLVVRVHVHSKGFSQVKTLVTITDINDNAPIFVQQPYYAVVDVQSAKAQHVTTVFASDSDIGPNQELRFELIGGGENHFRVNRKSGDVSVRQRFRDADANQEFILTIRVSDQGLPYLYAETRVTVKVITATTPQFSQTFYEQEVAENIPIGAAITTVSAESPTENKLIYTISDGDPYNEFTVVYSTGTLRVNSNLDYELTERYMLKVRATDVVTGDWADTLVIIKIKDFNDQKPVFSQLDYRRSISEAVTVGSEILTVTATDRDQGINSQLHYTIKPADDETLHHTKFDVKNVGNSAVIVVADTLDHETDPILVFILIATDGGNPRLSTEAYVHIDLIDINDNSPVFEDKEYHVEITDQVKKGQFVAMVAALDSDKSNEGQLMYGIVSGNDGQAFTIDQTVGSVSVSPFHDLITFKDAYILNISVTDGIYTGFTKLTIVVNPANRHSPIFDRILYNFRVVESDIADRVVIGTIKASDDDQGVFGSVHYSLIGDSMLEYFHVDPNTGEVLLKKALDREDKDYFMVPAMAQDSGGRTALTSIYIKVEDINDNTPQFLSTGYKTSVQTNMTVNTVLLTLSAFDEDTMKNSELAFSILSTDPSVHELFTLHPDTGVITLKRNASPDDAGLVKTFFVQVQDKGTPQPLQSSTSVQVTFTSMSLPSFDKAEMTVSVNVRLNVGGSVAQVQANYSGEADLGYRIIEGTEVRTNNPATFEIDSNGTVTLVRPLGQTQKYEFVVEAYTHTTPELARSVHMVVTLMSGNPYPPVYTSDEYRVSIAEDTPIGSTIIQVSSTDIDQDHETKIKYTFAPESVTLSNVFLIEPNHGYVSTLIPLDRETTSKYEFFVLATEMDTNEQKTAKAKVVIELLDVNDSPPRFTRQEIIAAVNEDAEYGTIVITLTTTDADTAKHSTNMFYISGGNDHGHFRIKKTGEVIVVKELDRELIQTYNLQISATDGVFVTSINVRIHILDANDNAPICNQALYTRILSEDVNSGSLVLRVQATDSDDPMLPSSKITYLLTGENSDDFTMDKVRGDIGVTHPLDRERVSEYHLTSVARDGGGLQCTADVWITLTDVNDNSPQFDQSTYTHTLPEDSINNTLLLRVTANDRDTGESRKVSYSIVSGSENTFIIDSLTGIVQLIQQVSLDKQEVYSMIISATDGGKPSKTGTTTLNVRIGDVNDPPIFEQKIYGKSMNEQTFPGTELLTVKAHSTDTGLNNVITYRITDSGTEQPLFNINPSTGVLFTAANFDFELVREYVLTVEATDAGDPPLSDSCIITIQLTDYNDNKPVFSQSAYSASVREDAKIGDHVIQIRAQDADSGVNSMLSFSVIRGDDLNQFVIDKDNGYISIHDNIDREAISRYELTVLAEDGGLDVKQSSTVAVIINILDINDNYPVFSSINYTAQVQVYPEGSLYRNTTFHLPHLQSTVPANTTTSPTQDGHAFDLQPLYLTVTDSDAAPNNGPFNYQILSGDSQRKFSIADDGLLKASGTFDLKTQDHYLLKIQVDDGGLPSLSTITYVDIRVLEATLHPPQVSPSNFTVVKYESSFPGGEVGYIQAFDPDNDPLTYGLDDSRYSSLISVDNKTGAIRSFSLDEGVYSLNVTVSDGRFQRYGRVNIHVHSVTEEMMSQAVGFNINGITDAEFISQHRAGLERALKTANRQIRRVVILSVTQSGARRVKRQISQSVVVLISVETSPGELVDKNTLQNIIRNNINEIRAALGGLQVSLTTDGYACSAKTVCHSDERCELGYKISADRITIRTNQQSFVSLVTTPYDKCACRASNCANPCLQNPCHSSKICIRGSTPNTHSCSCPAGRSGADCDILDGSVIGFDGSSYARWTLEKSIEKELNVKIMFRTKQADAVLMDARGERDYSTLEIVDGKLYYSFECGSGPATMRAIPDVHDGKWHTVYLERNGNVAKMLLDSQFSATAESPRDTEIINLNDRNVYFGASVKPFATLSIRGGFKGCMKQIKIQNTLLPYEAQNSVGSNALFTNTEFKCTEEHYGACSVVKCLNNGVCQETASGVTCACKGFEGAQCENDLDECARSGPCYSGSTCNNLYGSYECLCVDGRAGTNCDQTDECKRTPCNNGGTCQNVDKSSLDDPGFICTCTSGLTGNDCSTKLIAITQGGLQMNEIIYIIVGVLSVLVLVIFIVCVIICVRKRKQTFKTRSKSRSIDSNELYPRSSGGKKDDVEFYQRAPSPTPPSVPPRPASYTPSQNDLLRQHDVANDYGSAADGLNRLTDYRGQLNVTTFQPLPTQSPPSPTFVGPIKKPTWQFGTSSSGPKSVEEVPLVERNKPQAQVTRSNQGSRIGSKAPSITNGSFVSIPQEDEVSLESLHPKARAVGSGPKPLSSGYCHPGSSKGYHWDTSDWVQKKESDSIRGYPYAGRAPSMSEVDDSEYVVDSEFDDDVIPAIGEPRPIASDIIALQEQYKLDYDVPELNIPEKNRNHYLPPHIDAGPSRMPETQALLTPHIDSIPRVPERTASLSYSAEELSCLDEGQTGYTSHEGDTQSELSDDDNVICDIDDEDMNDLNDMLTHLKNDKRTNI